MKIKYQCMFCGKVIESKQPDPCTVVLFSAPDAAAEEQLNQQCYCHAACLKEVTHPSVPLYVLDVNEANPKKQQR